MDEKVTEIPTIANKAVKDFLFALIDPSWFTLCIEGKKIPKMLGRETEQGCEILLDGRWIYIFDSIQTAYSACSMAANALAIGQGYAWLGADSKTQPFAPTIMTIDP